MGRNILAAVAAVMVVSLAAVGVFASEKDDSSVLQQTPTATSEATATDTAEPTATAEPTSTPGATETPDDEQGEGNGHGPCHGASAGDADGQEGAPSCVHGIPDDNPSHEPEDGDGECDKGETEIKETPGGVMVNVPCHDDADEEDGDD